MIDAHTPCARLANNYVDRGKTMQQPYNSQAPKKPTNVSINSDLLSKAKALKINLSATLETALIELVNEKQRELWREENRDTIASYNQMVEEHGTLSDDLRSF
ncbi:type II toxin-antitoxin system CcdA family antitoxin [Ketobacter sp.]|uniref:type II toxin-antitoxin system CcdA family antitoxin n=2 Tax=Ketobacter sp. TaxID=2083498 RepID=UPI0025C57C4C|nr:type II toxin-antitoxin system CcdA family antitoxin [Ketobacter sp.]